MTGRDGFLFDICQFALKRHRLPGIRLLYNPGIEVFIDFLKKENQYRVNSFTKYLFEQHGYQAFYEGDDYPDDLQANPCLGLTANVIDGSNAFTTKIVLVLKNCSGELVLQTVEGKSKIKQYDKTYIDALKKCFVTIEELDYKYDPKALSQSATTVTTAENKKNDITLCLLRVFQNGFLICDSEIVQAALLQFGITMHCSIF